MLFDQFKGTNMNFRKTVLALSVLGAVGMSGCGGSSHKHPDATGQAELAAAESALTAALTGAITSGTVVTVVDGYASGCTVTSGSVGATAVAGQLGKYIFAGDPTGSLSATGCVDAHTGVALPPMSAPFPTGTGGLDEVNVTPVTTMVQSVVAADTSGGTLAAILAAAEATIRTALGLAVTADTNADPVEVGGALATAAAKIVAVAQVATGADSTVTDPIAALAVVIEANRGNPATDTLDEVVANVTLMQDVVSAAVAGDVAIISGVVTAAVDAAAGDADATAQVTVVAAQVLVTDDLAAVNADAAAATLDSAGVVEGTVDSTNIDAIAATVADEIVADVLAGDSSAVDATNEDLAGAVADLEEAVTDTGGTIPDGTGGTGGTGAI